VSENDLVAGPDGKLRCPWGLSAPEYIGYHDEEWGRPLHGDTAIFERLCLEGFQSGLSWLTILRKRENFRAAFSGFDASAVAAFGDEDFARLMADAGIVRNRAKINAVINNARAALGLPDGLDALVWKYAEEPGPAPGGFRSLAQRGDDLGERLRNAFEELLPHDADRALVVGSDTPALTPAHLEEAFAALETHDVVVGPTFDGGYWCIGLGRAAPELFRDIPWSTRDVLTRTLVRAHGAGLGVATVSTLADLDTPHDLALLLGAIAAGEPACGPSARAALHAMGMLPAALA